MKLIDINRLLTDYSYCISVDKSRYDVMCRHFSHYKLPLPKFFYGAKNSDGAVGCTLSHVSLINLAKSLNLPYILIFEDDAYPCKDILNKLDFYLNQVPTDCGVLLLGHHYLLCDLVNYKSDIFCKIIGDKFKHQGGCAGSHAYIIFKEAYDRLIEVLVNKHHADWALNSTDMKMNVLAIENALFIQKVMGDCITLGSYVGKYIYINNERNRKYLLQKRIPINIHDRNFQLTIPPQDYEELDDNDKQ